MSMKEMLRVSMNEAQVREACADWARYRTANQAVMTAQVDLAHNGTVTGTHVTAEVIFSKKRERKAKP